jgi:hypothetical protein
MSGTEFTEKRVYWSTIADAARYWGVANPPAVDESRDETSVIIPVRKISNARKIRDWLHKEFDNSYELNGLFVPSQGKGKLRTELPVAVRFVFINFDDKFLFALRWL